jgi:hypothetical protein
LRSIVFGPVTCRVAAPPPLVYQMLAAIGQGSTKDGERAEVVRRDGGELVADFWTRVTIVRVDRLVRTRERVVLRPPDQLDYEHLDGPVRGLRETITVTTAGDGETTMTYAGTYGSRNLLDYLRARLARPTIHRVMEQHFQDLRERAERRAARSRVFPNERQLDAPG